MNRLQVAYDIIMNIILEIAGGTFELVLLKYSGHWFLLYNFESIRIKLYCHNLTAVML